MALKSFKPFTLSQLLGFLAAWLCFGAQAGQVSVAVAANFAAPMKQIAAQFEVANGHRVLVSVGSTGKLLGQIANGAPFEVFLSADEAAPARLQAEGFGVAKTRFTYATGRLVLWSAKADGVVALGGAVPEVLQRGQFKRLAMASPKLAPYGAAAVEVLTQSGLLAATTPKWVTLDSIGQAYSAVASGNADLGFVALSQVFEAGKISSGSAWIVPAHLHRPLKQDALLLKPGQSNPAATALLAFLTTEPAQSVMRSFGYTH